LNILEAEGLTLSFGGIHALADVSIAVPRGGITAIIGPNGAGKTSLFNAISGFYRPERGTIRFDGADITRVAGHARAALGLARTFQNVALFRGMTVLDNIKLGRHVHMRTGLLDGLLYWGSSDNFLYALK
jgi:branched-chain amino acid transport system ATP-binding protein